VRFVADFNWLLFNDIIDNICCRYTPKSTLLNVKYTVCSQKNSAVSKVDNKFISRLTRAQRTPSAVATVQVSHALPAVRFSYKLP
jgi:hypothetical protein